MPERRGTLPSPRFLAAEIDLTDCIDLCDPKWAPRIRDIVAKMTDARLIERQHGLVLKTASGRSVVVADYDMPMDTFRRNRSDCSILNALWMLTARQEFRPRSIRAPFTFGTQYCSNSFLFDQSHIQIAVGDVSVMHNLRPMR